MKKKNNNDKHLNFIVKYLTIGGKQVDNKVSIHL